MSVDPQKIKEHQEIHQNWHLFKVWQCPRYAGRILHLWDCQSVLSKVRKDNSSRALLNMWILRADKDSG